MAFNGATRQKNESDKYKKWFPVNKGGAYRKWFGNKEDVINWENDGHALRQESSAVVRNPSFYFREGMTWNDISSGRLSMRYSSDDSMFEGKGPMAFARDNNDLANHIGFFNSRVAESLLSILCPTLNFNVGDIARVPILNTILKNEHTKGNVRTLIDIAHADWDNSEASYGFCNLPLLRPRIRSSTIASTWELWRCECEGAIRSMQELETRNNRLFIDAYGLQDELTPDVPDDQITLYRPEHAEDTKRVLSYAIGCIMGRYSLDKPGLIYAHSGNQGFDPSQYKTFRADDDGIIPLLETDWGIRDDVANRIVEFIGVAWPKEHLQENLKFIADSLGPNNGEQPRDTIRRYLATGFYKHHLSMYKKRPIYWLFSSGKQRAFQCLVYLHRYHEGTLARMRTEYVIPLQGKIVARIEQLEGDKGKATSSSHRNKLQKEQNDLRKQQTELFTFEEKLKHAADKKISLDLDDGVKVNYAKFGDLLAETKVVTGGRDEE